MKVEGVFSPDLMLEDGRGLRGCAVRDSSVNKVRLRGCRHTSNDCSSSSVYFYQIYGSYVDPVLHDYSPTCLSPTVKVVHDNGSDEGLAQTRGKRHERVAEERSSHDLLLVLPHGVVNGVDPCFCSLGIYRHETWRRSPTRRWRGAGWIGP